VVNFSCIANEQKVLVIASFDLQELRRTRQFRRQAGDRRRRRRRRRARVRRRRDVADGRRLDGGADLEAVRRGLVGVDEAEAVGGHRVAVTAFAVGLLRHVDAEGLHRILEVEVILLADILI